MKTGTSTPSSTSRSFLLSAFLAAALLLILFFRALEADKTVFSNDGPLGGMVAQLNRMPAILSGIWTDLNWLGSPYPTPSPNVSTLLRLLTSPLWFSKLYCPAAIFCLGLAAWVLFRELKLSVTACVLGVMAVALNSDFFSTACWGVAGQLLSFGANYLALAALISHARRPHWAKLILAGLAVGLGILEGYDIGAIFSLFVAAFALYQSVMSPGPRLSNLGRGSMRVGVVALCAAIIASSALSTLIGTQIQGVAGMDQEERSKAARWSWATQWSIPKLETLNIFVPGIFGYRMDTPMDMPAEMQPSYTGGNYWGRVGSDLSWDDYYDSGRKGKPGQGFMRYGAGGNYAGILVVLIAAWAIVQSWRRQSPFSEEHRRIIWFFSGVMLLSLLLAWGRFAPVFQIFFALPYASTIRNPAKFMHVFHWAQLLVFALGVNTLSRRYLEGATGSSLGVREQFKSAWARAAAYDRKWMIGVIIAFGALVLAWLIYTSSRDELVNYLQSVGFDSRMAAAIAGFSIGQAGWFILFLTVALGLMLLVWTGYFGGRRAKLGAILLGLVLIADLGRADLPFVIIYNYKEKYIESANNPVIDYLRRSPYEQRVTRLPFNAPPQLEMQGDLFRQLYDIEWTQHLFQYYNIQCLDIIQMPRAPAAMKAFETALGFDGSPENIHRIMRRWQLTNTRYQLGLAGYAEVLNQQLDPQQRRFRPLMLFDVHQSRRGGPLMVDTNTVGPFALFEFTGALPRARLYSNWFVNTNDDATLKLLADPTFDPAATVLVSDPLPAPDAGATNASAGTVEFTSYAPKRITLKTRVEIPAVLLLNDKYDPAWRVNVDGQSAPLLRCNYVMRGVFLKPGAHTVEFVFELPMGSFYVSLAAIVAGLLLLGIVIISERDHAPATSDSTMEPGNTPARIGDDAARIKRDRKNQKSK